MHATNSAAPPPSNGQQPTQQEIDHIVGLYESGEHEQMEHASRALLERHPDAALAWSVLAMALQLQGKDGLPALQKTVELAPGDAEAHLHLGNAHMDGGHPELAMPCFMRALELAPGFAEALSRLGDALQAQGHLKEAAECYRGALDIDPALVMAQVGKGDIQVAQQQFQPALTSYRQALALQPGGADIHRKLGDVHVALNRPEAALKSYAAAIELDAGNAMAHGGMGNVLFRLDRNAQAAASYRSATALPAATAAHYLGLGRCLHALGETADAESAYRQAIALDASVAAPMLHYADLLRETRRKEQAIAIYQAVLLLEPDNIDALNNLGMAQQDDGQLEAALASFRRVELLAPNNPVTHSNIAAILNSMGRRDEALESCRRAVRLDPKFAPAHVNLGTCLMEMGRLTEAVNSLETAVKFDPHHRRAYVNLSATLTRLGRVDQAIAHSRKALKLNPDWDELHSNLLFYLTHSQDINAASLFAEHLKYADHFEAPLRASWPKHANTRDPERRLRIGFVSADLYNHAVASFITPILEHLSKSPQFELIAYANSYHDDNISRHLHGLFVVWRQVEKLTHAELAHLITRDAIDILIDLSGHSGFNRLPAFARKPAPVQVSWIGYPGTTGLQAMDYFFSDNKILPAGEFDHLFLEKIVRLPISAPFIPYRAAPEVGPLPALRNGHLTFGSFNRANKLNRKVIALWSQVLRAIPDASILLAGQESDGQDHYLREWFAKEGINGNRLHLHRRSDMAEYLQLHQQVDICLNTFPYTGTTTMCHALWMGVPTLSAKGKTIPSRASPAYLAHMGLEAFVADNDADFVGKAVFWSNDIAALATLRAGMREQFIRSPIAQPELISAGAERALRIMWRQWCQQLHPISFDAMHHDYPLPTPRD
ncbi:tetratricopeptide repeat protein [Janthinobacterium sp. RB2R34]|uniref:tetratricopeptide repeat protein n=1 Tax=Janthinobacterium sp. RB2R34 TaxID=3424193 RepID=UPI003F20FC91